MRETTQKKVGNPYIELTSQRKHHTEESLNTSKEEGVHQKMSEHEEGSAETWTKRFWCILGLWYLCCIPVPMVLAPFGSFPLIEINVLIRLNLPLWEGWQFWKDLDDVNMNHDCWEESRSSTWTGLSCSLWLHYNMVVLQRQQEDLYFWMKQTKINKSAL